MFTFQPIREELYNIKTFSKNSDYVIKVFRSASSYNELSYDLFTFAKNANNKTHIDLEYFIKMNGWKYHTIRMVNVYEYECLLNILKESSFELQGMTIDYIFKRLYFDSFEISIKCLYEIYKKIGEIPGLIYSVKNYIEDFQFLYMNYTAILALIAS